MKLTPRTAGAATAVGGMVFVLASFGLRRIDSLLGQFVDLPSPAALFDCCGCFGVGAFAVPLGLLALTLFREPPEA